MDLVIPAGIMISLGVGYFGVLYSVLTEELGIHKMDATTKSFCIRLVKNKFVLYLIMFMTAPMVIMGSLLAVVGFALTVLGIGLMLIGYASWFMDQWVPYSMQLVTGPEIRTFFLHFQKHVKQLKKGFDEPFERDIDEQFKKGFDEQFKKDIGEQKDQDQKEHEE